LKTSYGPWAFINGGSEGIGAEIGNFLAANGVNIAMVARNAGALEKQKAHLLNNYSIEVRAETVDLAAPDAAGQIIEMTRGLDVGFYAHVASSAPLGAYLDTPPQKHEQALQVNVNSLHQLTYHFATGMREKAGGGIMLCSSMASLSAFPFNAQYAADKAYIRLLGEALWYELKEHDIDVLSLVISEVSTPALLRSGSELQGGSKTLTPSQVVNEAFSSLGRQPSIITGRRNRLSAFVARHFVPKKTLMKLMAREIERYKEPPEKH
jgi:short-subunit dehydrogenase